MLLTKLVLIGVIFAVMLEFPSMTGWVFVAVPVIYLIWRIEPKGAG